jgi:Zn-dependent protease/CBS domain-containing protein
MRGWRIGSLGGITIEINYTWLFLFALFTWNLATLLQAPEGAIHWLGTWVATWLRLPQSAPGHPDWVYWVAGAIGSLLVFVSVLTHEMCHSLVGTSLGMKISRITLFLFGGVSQMEDDPRTARVELLMTVVGPGSSLVLGLLFLALAKLSQALTGSHLLPAGLLTLGAVNLMLAVFNLLPAFPLDGGRLLRSILWGRWRDEYRATRTAAGLGAGLAGAMMAYGAFMFLFASQGQGTGIWFFFLGWMILGAARQSRQMNEYKFRLSGLQAGQVMQWPLLTFPADLRLNEALHSVAPTGAQPLYPVVDGEGHAIGVLDQRALAQVTPDQWAQVTVRQIMSPLDESELAIQAQEPVTSALNRLARGGRGWLLVISPEDKPVGIVTEQSILNAAQRVR